MTYTSVRKILIDNDSRERSRYDHLLQGFEFMGELCSVLRSRRLERGSLDFTVNRAINEPRIPDVMGIIQVASKTVSTYGASDLGLPAEKLGLAGSPTRVANVWEFKKDRRSEVLQGNPKHVSGDAVARLREWGGL